MATIKCDYNHYDADEFLITRPADVWVQNVDGEWTPLCAPCLPEFWYGDERADQPYIVFPIQTVPPGKLCIKKMEDR